MKKASLNVISFLLMALALSACGGGGGSGNRPPVAEAGADQTVLPGTMVSLDGTGSQDPNGDPLTYEWSLTPPAGSSAVLSDASSSAPSFTADKPGTYGISLIVNDGRVSSPADTVTVIANTPPVADAGPDEHVATGAVFTLDGTASSDADGDALTYSWSMVSKPQESAASLSDAASSGPAFTSDKDGEYVLTLTVGDGLAWSSSDQVTITASVTIGSPSPTPMEVNVFYPGQLTADSYSLSSGDSFNLATFSLSADAFVSAWAGSQAAWECLDLRAYQADALLDPWFSSWGTWDLGSLEDGLYLPAGDYVVTLSGGMALPFDYSSVVWRADAATGVFDTSFDGDGKREDAAGSGADMIQEIAVQPDGCIIAAGLSDSGANLNSYDLALIRYARDGSLDPSFGTGGKLRTTLGFTRADWAREAGIALQPDGKIVAAATDPGDGDTDFAVMRYLHDGSPDTSFGVGGKVTIDIEGQNEDDRARDVGLQEDGTIVVVGESGGNMAFAVLDPDGVLDGSFHLDGTLSLALAGTASASSVALRPDGRICAAGRVMSAGQGSFALVSLNTDGTLDTSMNGTGTVLEELGVGEVCPRDMAIQDDGKVLVTGHYTKGLNVYGQPDCDVAVLRYLASGDLDTGFGTGGVVTMAWGATEYDRSTGIAIEPDGRIVVTGWYDESPGSFYSWSAGLARFLPDGSLDAGFDADGKLAFSWPSDNQVSALEDLAVQPDGRIVVGGFVDTYKNFVQYMHSFAMGRFR